MTRIRRGLACSWIALALAGGCASGGEGGDAFMTRSDLASKLDQAISATQWPPAIRPTSAALVKSFEPERRFERGFETTLVQIANACAWYMAWTDTKASGDTADAENALRAMEEVVPTYGFASGDPATVQFFKDIPAKARLGDPTGVNNFIKANGCRETLAAP